MFCEDSSLRCFAHIGIRASYSLADVAKILGEIFSVEFVEDKSWRYDEFPAFVVELQNIRFALLGVPEPGDDLREDPIDDFELMIEPIESSPDTLKVDVSEEALSRMCQDGRLDCWLLR